LADGFDRLIDSVGGRFSTDPLNDAKWPFTPAGIALFEGFSSDPLASTKQGGCSLELLNGQQSQRVSHQHGNPFATVSACYYPLQSPQGHRVCR
jgi:hypothetical protein